MTAARRRIALLGRALVLAVLAAGALGCSTTPSAPPPSEPAVLGLDWGRVASVERPANYEETVSPSYPGTHPILRIQGQATMIDVIPRPSGGYVAVGYVPPDWVPVAWASVDGQAWALHPMGATGFTFPVSLATSAGGAIVAVGREGNVPTSWTTTDGIKWDQHAVALADAGGVAERMTAVAVGPNGFVAGGSVGPELLDRHARFWRSADGITWQPIADDPVAFANAEVRAITPFQGGFVAVGVVGSVQAQTGAVAWRSTDGVTWKRIDDPTFAGGEAVSVAISPSGGLLAVGAQVDRRSALAWTSPDGEHWTRMPSQPSLEHSGGFAWMTDVTTIGDVEIGVGVVQGLQRGTATSWVSRDGLTWQVSRTSPVQEGAEFYAITGGTPGAYVVGAFGAPDSYVPEVWLTPAQ